MNTGNIEPAQPMPAPRAVIAPAPQSEATPEQDSQTDAAGADRLGTLLNSIETPGSESSDTARPAPLAVRPSAQVWVVQIASFVTDKEAESLANKLKIKGYDAYVASAEVAGRTWYRVEVGRLANRNEARELQKTLQANEKIGQSIIAIR